MVRKRGVFSSLNLWIVGSVCLVALFWIVSIVVGFIWYPAVGGELSAEPTENGLASSGTAEKPLGFLQLICGGLGFVNTQVYRAQPGPQPVISSDLAWTDATWDKIRTGDPSRGAAISSSCIACHGQEGISTANYIPNIAGLPREVIYKQLIDYQTGKRNYVIMNAVAAGLSDQDIADVAAYYSNLPMDKRTAAGKSSHPTENTGAQNWDEHISRLFTDGDPIRNVVACAACHGPEGLKTGAPPLMRQPVQYLFTQLTAFSEGTRMNDINRQMRLIAGRLTPDEINGLAEYLGSKTSRIAGQKSTGPKIADP
jgi:cytochrome c553